MEKIVQDVRSLVLVDYTIEVVCIAAHYLGRIRACFWFHDRSCEEIRW